MILNSTYCEQDSVFIYNTNIFIGFIKRAATYVNTMKLRTIVISYIIKSINSSLPLPPPSSKQYLHLHHHQEWPYAGKSPRSTGTSAGI